MEKSFNVISMGELLIDFTTAGKSRQGNGLFEACPGGTPCNVLAMLNKLGRKTAFIGKVGDDQFGKILKGVLEESGIDTSHLLFDPQVHTTLAFVHTGENGVLISFDPNLRPPLWASLSTAKEQMEYGFRFCDILKISDNEIQFVSGKEDYDEGVRYLKNKYGIPLIFLTMGSDGSRAYYKDMRVECKAVTCDSIETTGAGDTFCGSALDFVLDYGLNHLTETQLLEMLRFANTAAAIVTTRKGAIRAMPEKEEVEKLKGNSFE